MNDLIQKLAAALGIENADQADEGSVVKAVEAAVAERDQAKTELAAKDDLLSDDKVTLEDRAKAEGKIVIAADSYKELTDRVAETERQLTDTAFGQLYDKAVEEGRVAPIKDKDGNDVNRERYRKLYDQDADTTKQLLETAPKIVNTAPKGKGGTETVAGNNFDIETEDGNLALDRKVRKHAAEKGISYTEALEAVQAELDQEEDQ